MRGLLGEALTKFCVDPQIYVLAGVMIVAGLSLYAWLIDRRWQFEKLAWVIYLGAVSIWEEWVFRLAVPYYLVSEGVELFVAVVAVNAIFAIAHYFTLRWKWQWCVTAFLFGMLLSRQMDNHFDLLLVAGIHWVFTYLNTPRLPGRRLTL